jgi:hypothetical protein
MKAIRHMYPVAMASMVLCFAWLAFADTERLGDNPQFLFVQSAARTSFKDGKLTLSSPSTVYFSERPARLTGHMTSGHFVRLWTGNDSLQKDPPNAILSVFVPNGKPTKTVITLQNPRLENSDLVYDVSVLKGSLPDDSAEAALFIDGWRLRSNATGWDNSCFDLSYLPSEFDCSG